MEIYISSPETQNWSNRNYPYNSAPPSSPTQHLPPLSISQHQNQRPTSKNNKFPWNNHNLQHQNKNSDRPNTQSNRNQKPKKKKKKKSTTGYLRISLTDPRTTKFPTNPERIKLHKSYQFLSFFFFFLNHLEKRILII